MAAADEDGVYGLARVFFEAATKASPDSEDILPQEVSSSRPIRWAHAIFAAAAWSSAAQQRCQID